MKFKLEINMDNAAFEPAPEFQLIEILHRLTARFERIAVTAEGSGNILDSNGNKVGTWEVAE